MKINLLCSCPYFVPGTLNLCDTIWSFIKNYNSSSCVEEALKCGNLYEAIPDKTCGFSPKELRLEEAYNTDMLLKRKLTFAILLSKVVPINIKIGLVKDAHKSSVDLVVWKKTEGQLVVACLIDVKKYRNAQIMTEKLRKNMESVKTPWYVVRALGDDKEVRSSFSSHVSFKELPYRLSDQQFASNLSKSLLDEFGMAQSRTISRRMQKSLNELIEQQA